MVIYQGEKWEVINIYYDQNWLDIERFYDLRKGDEIIEKIPSEDIEFC